MTELNELNMDPTQVCRGCLNASGEMKNMIEYGLLEDFYKFSEVKVDKPDMLSGFLCSSCEEALMECRVFRLLCQQTDNILKNAMKVIKMLFTIHFSGRKFLNQHYNNVHKAKNINCGTCGLSFPTQTAFERHLHTCNYTYECTNCHQVYKTNERLLVHLMRKHPILHQQYKNERKAEKRKLKIESKPEIEYFCDSPKRSFATQTLRPEDNIKNDITLPSWPEKSDDTKTDEISTQTVFEDLLSLKSQASEDDPIYFSESVSDIQTQTFSKEFGLNKSNKETITSETQSPDLSIKETQTCLCLYDSPKFNCKLFESVSSSPVMNLTSTETQTADFGSIDAFLGFNTAETQTSFDEILNSDL
ncbi:uncharacterized protein LOC106721709 [Papilio machaon]|uniref:uncharacterized protein LOC106721709 n=1 Tax=Papilio machaon TaxID=76193 RepID=UPI001E662CA1|nr:uncharacterized protein LOC106721709 [Papilio machaon]